MQISRSTSPHDVTQNAARCMPGYLRSTTANGVSAHYFRTPVTLSDALRFKRAVSLVAASDRAVCVSSASANIVFSVLTQCVLEDGDAKRVKEVKETVEIREAKEAKTAMGTRGVREIREVMIGADEKDALALRGTKRGREADETPASQAPGWIPNLFRRAAGRKIPSAIALSATATSTTAMNAIAGAKRAAEDSKPRVVLDEEAWRAAEHCVAALDRLCSTDGSRVVQQLAVSVNQQRGDLRLFAQCPQVIVLARVAAGLATPLADVLHAVPRSFRMDGLLSTSTPTSIDPIGGALSARPTEEEAAATNHGQPPLCVVIGLASAQQPGAAHRAVT